MFANNKIIATTGPIRLVGRWAWLTGIFGYGFLVLTLVIMILGTSYGYQVVSQSCENPCQIYGQLNATNFQDLQKIGISVDTYATTYVVILWIFTFVALSVGALILWKKPGELLPFCAATLIMGLPSVEGQFVFFSNLFQDYPFLGTIYNWYGILGDASTAYLFLTFPNGRFKGRIFWLIFIGIGVAPTLLAFYLTVFSIPYNADPATLSFPLAVPLTLVALIVSFIQEKKFSLRNVGKYLFWSVLCFLAILDNIYATGFLVYLIALIYMSVKILTPRERVPTKWLIYGFTVFNIMIVFFGVIWPLLPQLQTPGSYWFLLYNVAGFFGCSVNLAGILMAVVYANAFDINLVIKRTVVYTALTLLIIGIYLGSVVVLQELVRTLTGQQSGLAVVGATLVAALLFQPLHRAIQGFVDRRFYRRKYDAAQAIHILTSNLQNETDLPTLTTQVKAVLDQTMEPQTISIWIKNRPVSKRNHGL